MSHNTVSELAQSERRHYHGPWQTSVDDAPEREYDSDHTGDKLRQEAMLKRKLARRTTGVIGGNDSWLEDGVSDAKAVEGYKRDWAEHGFPDVSPGSKRSRGVEDWNAPSGQWLPEQRLLAAMIQIAWEDVWRASPNKKTWRTADLYPTQLRYKRAEVDNAKQDAVDWFKSPRTDEGAFIWCCNLLSWAPDYIRKLVFASAPTAKRPKRKIEATTDTPLCNP